MSVSSTEGRKVGQRMAALITMCGLAVAMLATFPAIPAQASVPATIVGAGTSSDPFQVDTAAEFIGLAETMNDDPTTYTASCIDVVADLDFSAAGAFPGIDTFSGVLDGQGHTLSTITYTASDANTSLALVRTLSAGTIANLTISGLTANNGTNTTFVGGLAIDTAGATITGNTVTGAVLTASAAEKVGGLVAVSDGSTITDNYVDATITANEMPAGIAAYAKNASVISRNLVRADLSMLTGGGTSGTKGNDAGMIVGYPGTPNTSTFANNVAWGGSIAYTGLIDGFVGRILGYTAYSGWTATDNLANSAITISAATVTGPGTKNQHGTDTTAEALALEATYTALGWDFTSAWSFDSTAGHPVPKYTYSLDGSGTSEAPYEISTPSDLEFLAEQINASNTTYTAATNFVLTNDLDFTDRSGFVGFNTFTATLDGAGHTISNLTYAVSSTSNMLAFIRNATAATVTDLTLDGVTATSTSTTEGDFVAGLIVNASATTITRVALTDLALSGPGAEKVAGLVAVATGASSVTNNWVDGTATGLKLVAGVAAYATNTSTLSNNLVSMDLTTTTALAKGRDAGHVIAYPGSGNSITVSGNVALSGSITCTGTVAGFAGRIVGYYATSGNYKVGTLTNNLGNAEIKVGGSTVTGTATTQHGADTTAADLALKATYVGLGWDFSEQWMWDNSLNHPVPRFVEDSQKPNRITTTINGDPGTGRGFTWYSTISSDSAAVQMSSSNDLSDAVTTTATRKTSVDGETFYQAVVTGLAAGNRYYYRVGDPDLEVWSNIGSFLTPDGSSDFSFIDLTDTQAQSLTEAELSASSMAKALATVPDAQFMMHNGDVVEDGEDESDWSDLLDSAQSSLLATTIVPAAGNHDADAQAIVDHFSLAAPNDQNTATGAYYSFDYNKAHFVVLNTNEDSDQNLSQDQLDWLKDDVTQARANGAKWVILNMHKGAYTTANHLDDSDVIAMRKVLVPLIDELDIDLVLQGHDHVMSRTKTLAYDADNEAQAKVVSTDVITEIINGKRIEYSLSPKGTIYFLPNTAGAKHYTQATSASALDLESYLNLFDRTGAQDTENFLRVRISDQRLTVDVYDIRDEGQPRLFESFGIDREVDSVDDTLAALPDEAALGDAEAFASARTLVDGLSSAQQGGLANLARLTKGEAKLRELTGAVVTDGSQIAWAATDASSRQAVSVRNTTTSTFTEVPVRVTLDSTPQVASDALAFFTTAGVPLPYEVESWNPGSASVLWVRVPKLAAESAATIWAYYDTTQGINSAAKVWAGDYSLVEHFATSATAGNSVTDSTGKASGVATGGDWTATAATDGDSVADLGSSRLQYAGDIGGDYDRIAISSVISVTAAELATLSANAPIVAKESTTDDGQLTFWQGITPAGQVATRLAGNSFEFGNIDLSHSFDISTDGTKHLVTQTYDGMTYTVFIDGKEVHSQMVEYRSTYGAPAVLTTIGDYYTNTGNLAVPFPGTASEIQLAGKAFTPDFEAFRYANYFGNVVSLGALTTKAEDPVVLVVTTPSAGSELSAGLVTVKGSLTKAAQLSATIAGEEVFTTAQEAGNFTVSVPINALGAQELTLTATTPSGSASQTVALTVADTVAPNEPTVSDTSADATAANPAVTLTSTPQTEDREQVTTKFYANPSIPITAENTVVRTGSTTASTPASLTLSSGEVSSELLPTTVGDDENPYQIYSIQLTDAQAAQDQFHLAWQGTSDKRRVSGWVWDNSAGSWVLIDSDADTSGGTVSLDLSLTSSQNVLSSEKKLNLLIWRGLTAEPFSGDYTEPDKADYDWGLDHIPDTQLYTQATPDLFVDQLEYVRDRAKERNTQLVIQSGDLVNREYLSQEYQWVNAEPGIQALEDADIPYMVSWGNHDYAASDRNGRLMLPTYYPMSRLEASLDGSNWTFGGSNSIDNYYYLGEIDGAKLLVLTVGHWSADSTSDTGLAWAADVIADNPDRTVILAVHNSVNTGTNNWSNSAVLSTLIDPYSNVKLVLGGHIGGTGVAMRTKTDGTTYGILTDYQSRVYGGQEYLKHLSIDAENGLIYVNTYSPLLDTTTSSYSRSVTESDITGYHGSDTENFVLELDLGGTTTRTLKTGSLSLSAGAPTQVGDAVTSVGATPASATFSDAAAGTGYEWYAELTDAAGLTTRSTTSTFAVEAAAVTVPSAPQNVVATVSGTQIAVTWSAPANDGGAEVQSYEVRLDDGSSTTVSALEAVFAGLPAGTYVAEVRASNSAGWSQWSQASAAATITATPTPTPTPSASATVEPTATPSPTATPTSSPTVPTTKATVSVKGHAMPNAKVTVTAKGLNPGSTYTVQLRPGSTKLAQVKAGSSGSFTTTVRIPTSTKPGKYSLAIVSGSSTVASTALTIHKVPVRLSVSVPSSHLHKGRRAKITIQVSSSATTPTGKVLVRLGNGRVAKATIKKGKATITLARFAKAGKYRIRVSFSGTSVFIGKTTTKTVSVRA
jgi:hypothetical protein